LTQVQAPCNVHDNSLRQPVRSCRPLRATYHHAQQPPWRLHARQACLARDVQTPSSQHRWLPADQGHGLLPACTWCGSAPGTHSPSRRAARDGTKHEVRAQKVQSMAHEESAATGLLSASEISIGLFTSAWLGLKGFPCSRRARWRQLLPGDVLPGLNAQGYRWRTGEQPREPPRPPAPALPAGSSGMREGLASAT